MIHAYQDNLFKSYKRKSLKRNTDKEQITADGKSIDMDIANTDDEDVVESPESPPPGVDNPTFDSPASPPIIENKLTTAAAIRTSNDSPNFESPSMSDLQRQKRALLQALAESGDTSLNDSLLNDMLDKTIDNNSPPDSSIANKTPMAQPRLSNVNDSTPLGTTISVVTGTPLLKTSSPYGKLPDGSNWSVGVSDVIDFENLPDATGTYDKLSGLIRKVRTVVSRINEANDAEDDDD